MSLSRAQRRVMGKIRRFGFVLASRGLHAGRTCAEIIEDEVFDRQTMIDRMLVKKLLQPGDGAGQFVKAERK